MSLIGHSTAAAQWFKLKEKTAFGQVLSFEVFIGGEREKVGK